MTKNSNGQLKRELGVFPALMMGLGSILGTGIFVSIGIAAGIAGPSIILAIAIAAIVATFNALSSAQLAAAHPVSGGTYEYGYRFLTPPVGFLAGWMFLLAKSASAATAALGFAGYLLVSLGLDGVSKVAVAFVTVLIFTGIVLCGIRRSSHINIAIVSVTLLALLAFTASGIWFQMSNNHAAGFTPFFSGEGTFDAAGNLLHATALMFVAYTGYGRIATLAEEVNDPRRTIPRAIIATLVVSALIYIAVSIAGVGAVGAAFLFDATEGQAAPLELAVREMGVPVVPWIIAIGAATAMLGVLLNLILGLSRVFLAMGRRQDMPGALAKLDAKEVTPAAAVLVTGLLIAGLTLIGSVKTTWSFSAFTVLTYYAITNASAIAMPKELRLFPRWIPIAGLVSCLGLAFWVETRVWMAGMGLGLAGLIWFAICRLLSRSPLNSDGRNEGS
jgi:APA family basic amino acid/polyamine antiporter